MAQAVVRRATESCVAINSSSQCASFNSFVVSTDSFLVGLYPFLQNVNSTETFDKYLSAYVKKSYVQLKYETLFGCGNKDLTNTTDLYARFTTSVVCNGIIQNSKDRCGLSAQESRPLCANSCAEQALSESVITSNSAVCSNPSNYADTQIRADFTNCALPAQSLHDGDCIQGSANEPNNCGFGNSTLGLCTYCSDKSDDSCCSTSQASSRCANVAIPTSVSTISLPISTSSSRTSSPAATISGALSTNANAALSGSTSHHGLSATNVGLIVVGCVVGVVLLALLICMMVCWRKRRRGKVSSTPFAGQEKKTTGSRSDLSLEVGTPTLERLDSAYTILPGGRIARRSALIDLQLNPADLGHPEVASTGVPMKSPAPVVLGMSDFEPRWIRKTPSDRPQQKQVPQRDQESNSFSAQPLPGQAFYEPKAEQSLADKDPLSPLVNQNDYELLPGGRLARRHVSGASQSSSRAASPNRLTKAPLVSHYKAGPVSEDYVQLPGGRIVRKSALINQVHNNGLKKSSNILMSGALGAGAVASAAKIRHSDEQSRHKVSPSSGESNNKTSPSRFSSDSGENHNLASVREDNDQESPDPVAPDSPPSPKSQDSDEAVGLDLLAGTGKDSVPPVPSFKDAYSETIFHAGDLVVAIWSYQPQTQDEHALERGDMIEIVNVWNDGWATGKYSSDRIDTWESKHGILIDTDLIELDDSSELQRKETSVVKAFPLVLCCAPRYWRKAIRDKESE